MPSSRFLKKLPISLSDCALSIIKLSEADYCGPFVEALPSKEAVFLMMPIDID